jgi:hypothetical protein
MGDRELENLTSQLGSPTFAVITPNISVTTPPPQHELKGLLALPFEIQYLIFEPLRPVLCRRPFEDKCISSSEIQAFNTAWKKYADLRLLHSSLDPLIVKIAFETIALLISSSTRLENITRVFTSGAAHIRSVIIFGAGRHDGFIHPKQRSPIPKEAAEILGRGLGLCAQVRNLECYGEHPAFTHRSWLPRLCPKLGSTVKTLSIRPYRPLDLSHSLVAIGRSLEELEIHEWPHHPRTVPFHLPSSFPNLTKLTLRKGNPCITNLNSLLSIIQKKSTLHSMAILHMPRLWPQSSFKTLLANSLGPYLTSLDLGLSPRSFHSFGFQTSILQACPRLIALSVPVVDFDVFDYIPLGIKSFNLGLGLHMSLAAMQRLGDAILLKKQLGLAIHSISIHVFVFTWIQSSTPAREPTINRIGEQYITAADSRIVLAYKAVRVPFPPVLLHDSHIPGFCSSVPLYTMMKRAKSNLSNQYS